MEIKEGGGESFPQIIPYSLLAIDLGETTGIAACILGFRDLRCTSTKNPLLVLPLIALLQPSEILLERFPDNPQIPYEVENAYQQLAPKSILISPGSWKPFMKSWKRFFPQAKTQHEKDAVNILRYYLITTTGKDILCEN